MAAIKLFVEMITVECPVKVDHDHHRDHATSKTTTSSSSSSSSDQVTECDLTKKPDMIVPCPRCRSIETKFCYFNNYNVNQPKHFCKGCHRYWTAGGALRNVPVGTGRRKSRPPPLYSPPAVPSCGRRDLRRLRRSFSVDGAGEPSASSSTCRSDEEDEDR